MQWLQHPNQSNIDNLNNVRHEGSNKKDYLKAKIDELETNSKIKKISETYIGVSMNLRRVTILELI